MPAMIANELLEDKRLDLVWIIRDDSIKNIPISIRTVRRNSVVYFFEMATARVWVDNVRKDKIICKRKGQYYLQTWHGNFRIKKIEKDVEDKLDLNYVISAKHDSSMIDLFWSGSKKRTQLTKDAFWYQGEIAKCGDIKKDFQLERKDEKKQYIFKKYNIKKDEKILLYAPTFRDDGRLNGYSVNMRRVREVLEEITGEKYVCMIRWHPNMRQMRLENIFGIDYIDATYEEDELAVFAACDYLITDYSGTMFKAALFGAKVFLYTPDIDEYAKERDFYVKIKDLPFPKSRTNENLIENIRKYDEKEYHRLLRKFCDNEGFYRNGAAGKYLAKWILKITVGERL